MHSKILVKVLANGSIPILPIMLWSILFTSKLPEAFAWSRSLFGFTAQAFTPSIWLTGLSLIADSYYFKLAYSK